MTAAMEIHRQNHQLQQQPKQELAEEGKNGWALTELEMYNIPRLLQSFLENEQRVQQQQQEELFQVQKPEDNKRGSKTRSRGKVCVLSIDGGGMRGIIAGKVLAHLERLLQAKSGDPKARIVDYFDLAAGTNVGGLLATMLFTSGAGGGGDAAAMPLMTAEEAWKYIAVNGSQIFGDGGVESTTAVAAAAQRRKRQKKRNTGLRLLLCGGRGEEADGGESTSGSGGNPAAARAQLRSRDGLDRCLRKVLTAVADAGQRRPLTLRDTLKPVLVPCYDLSTGAPFLFSRAGALQSAAWDFNLADVCTAAAATPGVFPPAAVTSVDGTTRCTAVDAGMVMNSPAAAALTHVLHNAAEFPGARDAGDVLLLSLGTGQFCGPATTPSGGGDWSRDIVLDNVSDMVDHMLALAFGGAAHRENYLRLQVVVPPGGVTAMDDASAGNVARLGELATQLLEQTAMEHLGFGGVRALQQTNAQRLEWFAEQLVEEQRCRALRSSPTVLLKRPL